MAKKKPPANVNRRAARAVALQEDLSLDDRLELLAMLGLIDADRAITEPPPVSTSPLAEVNDAIARNDKMPRKNRRGHDDDYDRSAVPTGLRGIPQS